MSEIERYENHTRSKYTTVLVLTALTAVVLFLVGRRLSK